MPIPGPPHTLKACHTDLRHSTPNQSPSHPSQALHTHPWSPHYSLALNTHPRPSIRVPGSTRPDLSYHPEPFRSVPAPIPHPFQPTHTHLSSPYLPKPSLPISGPPHPPKAVHTQFKSSTPSQSQSHPPKALYTILRPFTLISCHPHPPKALHTHIRHSMPLLGPLTLFLVLLHSPTIGPTHKSKTLQLQEEWH